MQKRHNLDKNIVTVQNSALRPLSMNSHNLYLLKNKNNFASVLFFPYLSLQLLEFYSSRMRDMHVVDSLRGYE